jgi:uncharacterized protein
VNYYLESSACVRLFVENQNSRDLSRFIHSALQESTSKLFTSWLTRLEVLRTLRRLGAETEAADQFFANTVEIRPSEAVLTKSTTQTPATLKTLDAIHLATVLEYSELKLKLVSYDKQLLGAARHHGVDAISPGL